MSAYPTQHALEQTAVYVWHENNLSMEASPKKKDLSLGDICDAMYFHREGMHLWIEDKVEDFFPKTTTVEYGLCTV